MEYKEILDSARTCIGPYCKACPVCNGKACGNQVPGPGAKAPGNGFIRNFDAWQKICVNMDTICPNEPVDTAVELFGTMYRYPFFAAPLGAMKLHYGEKYTDREYNSILVNACADSGIAAFTGRRRGRRRVPGRDGSHPHRRRRRRADDQAVESGAGL